MADKYIRYKFIMKIQDPDILKSLGFCVNLLFLNREDRTQMSKQNKIYFGFCINLLPFTIFIILFPLWTTLGPM